MTARCQPTDTTFRILALCASLPGNASVSARLASETSGLQSWDALLEDAEADGLELLLRAHLIEAGVPVPATAADRLTSRWMQHAHAYAVRTRVVTEVVKALESEAIRPLLLKGAALAHLVYGNPLLRPMRDVDLLVRGRDVRRAAGILAACGFAETGPPLPRRHHHAPAMTRIVDGAMVTIELHHQLLQPTPFLRRVEYDDVIRDAQAVPWPGHDVLALGREDMLWHVYAHAFAINVTRPAIRLISVADLVALTETWVDQIRWDVVRKHYGRAWHALPRLHQLTPWSPRVLATLGGSGSRAAGAVRRIAPRLEWSDGAWRDIAWPPDWWFGVRYGIRGPWHRLWHRVVVHPVMVTIAGGQWANRRWRHTEVR